MAEAQNNLAACYANGQGVPRDFVQAYKWFTISLANGNTYSARYRDQLATMMTPDQLAEAQRLAREWKPRGRE